MSFTEYRSTTGLPWGQLIGYLVFANSASSHSIFAVSSGIFTLIAAWQAMEAAIRRANLLQIQRLLLALELLQQLLQHPRHVVAR